MGSGRTEQQGRGGMGTSDDTYQSTTRAGGMDDYSSGGGQQTGGRTGGGLGSDDTYGDSGVVSGPGPLSTRLANSLC